MSDRLREAFNEASKLTAEEQDAFAAFLLAELRDESEWSKRFDASPGQLGTLAREARDEYSAGKTKPLDDDAS
jgi:hypothetical protein